LGHYTVHSLRHTNITIQIVAGVPLVTVSARAGHARTSITVDRYARFIKSSDQSAAIALDNIFNPTMTEVKTDETPVSNKADITNSNKNEIDDYKFVKSEMSRLGLDTYKEYYEYLDYLEYKQHKQNGSDYCM